MSSEAQLEVYRTLREAQGRYTYFLLAAAGAGIALAVNETHRAELAWSQLPLGLAVLNWGSSFFCGCRYLNNVGVMLYMRTSNSSGCRQANTPKLDKIQR